MQVRSSRVPDFNIPLTYGLIHSMKKVMSKPATHIVCGANVWSMLVSDPTVGALLDPPLDHVEIEAGYLGTLLECDIVTDTFMPVADRILVPNFFALVALNVFDHDTWTMECPIVVMYDHQAIHLCR